MPVQSPARPVAGSCVSRALLLTALVAAMAGASPPEPTPAPEPTWTDEQRQHWSFLPVERPELPEVERAGWARNPVDRFILEGLELFELPPAPEADRVTLIRRLTFDLTGLPPTPAEVDAFLADDRPDAYERLVDRLLDSPRFGERWARMWLDLARYAESDGFKSDKTRPDAWRYRDWVVAAFNADLPYDRFVRLQLAGDEAAPGDADAFVATGFNRHWPYEDNNMVPGLSRQLMLDDMTDTTASVFLGLTVACARCHDHKYDAISQKDYYRFQALFAASAPKDDFNLGTPAERTIQAAVEAEHRARLEEARRSIASVEQPYLVQLLGPKLSRMPGQVREALETPPDRRTPEQDQILRDHAKLVQVAPKAMRTAMAPADLERWDSITARMKQVEQQAPPALPHATGMTDTSGQAPPVFLLRKGNFKNPGEEIPPGFLSVLNGREGLPEGSADPNVSTGTTGRRLALASWIASPDNPLTARVIVNRLWQGHFGRGIVATPSDFGTQGAEPTHPELLDWLASELVRQGWSLKAMHRLMVTSATYRQSSTPPAATLRTDPENALFGRMRRHRLEGEAVRDALLAVAGTLDGRIGGPSVFPDLPPGVETRGGWTRSESEADRNRRSLYVFVRRNLKYPLFDAFDAPDTNVTCPERNISVNAPQALMLLNSELVLDQARSFAGRLLAEAADGNDLAALATSAYRLGLGRAPEADELARSVAFLESQPGLLSGRDAGEAPALPRPMPDGYLPARGAALVDFCHVLLNLNEFVFVD